MAYASGTEKCKTMYGVFESWKGDVITVQLKKYSAHTRNELAMLKSFIAKGDNIIDIGAHIGTYSIPFARFNGGKGEIFSFEANPSNYALLKSNIEANHLDKVIHPYCGVVSSESCKHEMLLPKKANSGMYYFLPSDNVSVKESSINIDDFFKNKNKNISLIKVDVEGAELSVLASCQGLIDKNKPMLYIEVNTVALERFGSRAEQIERFLRRQGYHFFWNVGERNSTNDNFRLAPLKSFKEGCEFFDFMAIHPSSTRYPVQYKKSLLCRLKAMLSI